jgi:aldose 1-epimerase
MKMAGVKLDDVFLSSIATGGDKNEAIMTDHNVGLELTYSCDPDFVIWVLHNRGGGHGFFCPEPYTWVTNAPNLPLDPSLTGLQSLAPGSSKTVDATLTLRWL